MGKVLKIVGNDTPPAVSLQVMQQVLSAQKARSQELKDAPARRHRQRLKQLHRAIKKHQTALTEAVQADLKAHPAEIAVVEWAPIFTALRQAKQATQGWHRAPHLRHGFWLRNTAMSETRHLARGSCLILCSWQPPLAQALIHLIAAIAVGNSVVLKTSNKTPNTANALADLVENELDPADVALFRGNASVGQALLSLPFDYVYACGNDEALRYVQSEWRNDPNNLHLQSQRMVLGIVDTSTDPEKAAAHIAWSRFRYAGQTDSGPHVLLVHEGIRHRFIKELKRCAENLYGETLGRQRYNKAYARLRDNEQFEHVRQLFIEARDHGAKDVIGGHFFQRDFFVGPTVLVDVLPNARLLRGPLAGPLLPLMMYSNDQALQDLLDNFKHSHAMSVYSRSPDRLVALIGNRSDSVLVNPSTAQVAANLIADMPSLINKFSLQQPVVMRKKQWFERLRPPWQEKKLQWIQRWISRLKR